LAQEAFDPAVHLYRLDNYGSGSRARKSVVPTAGLLQACDETPWTSESRGM
jgi:hypothetical protein